MSESTQPTDGQHKPNGEDGTAAERLNFGGLIAKTFIDNKLTTVLMLASLLFGLVALLVTPREENPQISVPAVNVIIPFPGASPQELEQLVTNPLEQLLWSINGVEHVHSVSYPDYAAVSAQFYVNENQELSISKVFNQITPTLISCRRGYNSPSSSLSISMNCLSSPSPCSAPAAVHMNSGAPRRSWSTAYVRCQAQIRL